MFSEATLRSQVSDPEVRARGMEIIEQAEQAREDLAEQSLARPSQRGSPGGGSQRGSPGGGSLRGSPGGSSTGSRPPGGNSPGSGGRRNQSEYGRQVAASRSGPGSMTLRDSPDRAPRRSPQRRSSPAGEFRLATCLLLAACCLRLAACGLLLRLATCELLATLLPATC